MAWATAAEVLTYTGVTVTSSVVDQAQAIVELFADATETASSSAYDYISDKNLRLLKLAVAYQAAWMNSQYDLFTRSDVGLMTQDGISFTTPHANANILAPMAKRAIDRLSWRRNRSQHVRPAIPKNILSGDFSDPTNDNAELEDNQLGWEPL